MAALALYAHYNISSTDKACAWSARPPNVISNNVKNIIDIYGTYSNPDTSVPEIDIDNFKKTLTNLSVPVGFSWLLKPELDIEGSQLIILLPSINNIAQNCKNFVQNNDFEAVKCYVNSKLYITDNIIIEIAEKPRAEKKPFMV